MPAEGENYYALPLRQGSFFMRAVIFANGDIPSIGKASELVKMDDFIVSADGGMRFIHAFGIAPDLLIGDLDSIQSNRLKMAISEGTEILKFPADKNETDLELAVNEVQKRGFDECLIMGGLGGRMDQTLANIYLLAAFRKPDFTIYMDDGCERLDVILDELEIKGNINDMISLIPMFDKVDGISTEGLKYQLTGETLFTGKTRGISNVLTADTAQIKITSGKLLCVHRRSECYRKGLS